MKETPYPLKKEKELVFSFISKGPKGEIEKIIRYDEFFPTVFNLGFGDRVEGSLEFDDKTITDNGDTRMVITTVISTLLLFFAHHPKYAVIFTGSDQRRTSLYNWIIEKHLDDFSEHYEVWGIKDKKREKFQKETQYDYFLINLK